MSKNIYQKLKYLSKDLLLLMEREPPAGKEEGSWTSLESHGEAGVFGLLNAMPHARYEGGLISRSCRHARCFAFAGGKDGTDGLGE